MLWNFYGGNVQNIPDKLRKIFIFDEGMCGIQADQAGAEALIVAHEVTDGYYRQIFSNGLKVHSWLAMHLFKDYWRTNTPYDLMQLCIMTPAQLKDNPQWKGLAKIIKESDSWEAKRRFYFIAKMVIHASTYGMKAPTFQMNVLQKSDGAIALSRLEAEGFLDMFHNLFPEIRVWHYRIRERIMSTRELVNLFGYPRLFMGQWGDSLWKEAYSWIPQSTVGCITNIAWVKMQEYIEANDRNWDLLINCHDSILMQVPLLERIEAAKVLQSCMEMPLTATDGITHYRMKSEVGSGQNWSKKSESNSEGMEEIKLAA